MKAVINLLRLSVFLKGLFLSLLLVLYVFRFSSLDFNTWAQGEVNGTKLGPGVEKASDIDLERLNMNQKVKTILKAKIRQIRAREASLEQREKDLNLLKEEIDKRIKTLKALQASLGEPLAKAQKTVQERFMHLVGVYSSMEPQRAALLLQKMDEATVVRIFSNMKSKKVAQILSYMETDKAARISSNLTKAR